MKNPELEQLLELIDSAPTRQINKENIYQPASKLYFAVKALYQSYKKSNQFTLLQHKIHKVVIKKQSKSNFQCTEVSPHALGQAHKLNAQQICNLLNIRNSIDKKTQGLLFTQVVHQINKLSNVVQVLKCFKKALRLKDCLSSTQNYKQMQTIMIQKIKSMPLLDQEFDYIANFIMSLPQINEQIIQFISQLYEKVQDIQKFKKMHMIFDRKFKQSNNLSEIYLKAFAKIIMSKETIFQIAKMIKERQSFARIVQQEAKQKLSYFDNQNTEKTKLKIDFIILVVQNGLLIWQNIIDWEKNASQECQDLFKSKIEATLLRMMSEEVSFVTVLHIASKMTEVQESSQIGAIFLRQFLKIQNKTYLSNLVIRRFIASKVLRQTQNGQNSIYQRILFDASLLYTQILLQIFEYKKQAVRFYRSMIESDQKCIFFNGYLRQLSRRKPSKLKQFFIKVDQTQKGVLFEARKYALIQTFGQLVSAEVAYNYLKEIATLPISRFTLSIVGKCLDNKKYMENGYWYKNIRSQGLKTINTILMHRTPQQIRQTQQFGSHFIQICRNLNDFEKQVCMKDIPQIMTEQIKKIFKKRT